MYSSALVYSGLLTRRGSIAPLALAQIEARAFILREGTYNLGGWTLTTTVEGKNWLQMGERTELRVRGKQTELKGGEWENEEMRLGPVVV